MINYLPIYMLTSLFFTELIELLWAVILQVKNKRDYFNVFLVNILTNPILVSVTFAINIFYGKMIKNYFLLLFEIVVIFIEGLIYQKNLYYKKINGYFLSLILNFMSFFFVIFINKIIW